MLRRSAQLICMLVCLHLIGCDSDSKSTSNGDKSLSKPDSGKSATAKAANPKNKKAEGPSWSCDTEHDFGEVWAGVTVRHPFEFHNVGNKTLNILETKARCSCSIAENHTKTVAPGEKGVIPFRLITANKSGSVNEYLNIKTNDPKRPFMKLTMTGMVKTVCELEVISDSAIDHSAASPQELEKFKRSRGSFGRIKVDDRLHRVIRLTNTTGSPLSLTLQSVRPTTPFKATLKEVEPGEVYELTVDGEPPFRTGHSRAGVLLKTNIPDRPNYNVPLSAYVPPRIEIIPHKIVADANSKEIKARTIRITNNEAPPFKVTSVAVSDPNFRVKVRPPNLANLNETITIDVVLPDGDYRPPLWGEVVRIETSDSEKSLIEINVLPHLRRPPTPRPAELPLEFHPGEIPGG